FNNDGFDDWPVTEFFFSDLINALASS
ncbi:hypothetical protein ISN44_As07g011850, partial [Arabidopsis suecica]